MRRLKLTIDCLTDLKAKKMKKLVWMAAAIIAVSFASCGNKAAADAAQAKQDSIRVADSIAAVAQQQAEAAAANDSVSGDSTATAAVAE